MLLPLAVPPADRPTLIGLAAIDDRPGLEIVTSLLHGASTDVYTLFRATKSKLQRIGPDDEPEGPFAAGSTVLDVHGVDCVRPGLVVQAGAGAAEGRRPRWNATLDYWRIDGRELRRVRQARVVVAPKRLFTLPGLLGPQPFPHCLEIRSP
jgi:hypothetical protein